MSKLGLLANQMCSVSTSGLTTVTSSNTQNVLTPNQWPNNQISLKVLHDWYSLTSIASWKPLISQCRLNESDSRVLKGQTRGPSRKQRYDMIRAAIALRQSVGQKAGKLKLTTSTTIQHSLDWICKEQHDKSEREKMDTTVEHQYSSIFNRYQQYAQYAQCKGVPS